MLKSIVLVAALSAASAVQAQMPAAPAPVCPAGTQYTTIRHSTVTPGQWAAFEKAVADHQAWYAAHGNGTTTAIVRMLAPRGGTAPLSQSEAVTITRYAETPQPAHDASWDAFIAEYKASSTIKDEMRVCMPAMPR